MVGPSLMLTTQTCLDKSEDGSVLPTMFYPAHYQSKARIKPATALEYFYDRELPSEGPYSFEDISFNYALVKLDRAVGDEVGYWETTLYDESWNGRKFWKHIGYTEDFTPGQMNPVYMNETHSVASVSKYQFKGVKSYLMKTDVDVGPGQGGGTQLLPCTDLRRFSLFVTITHHSKVLCICMLGGTKK